MPEVQLAGQPFRTAVVVQAEQAELPGVALDAPAMVQLVAAALEGQAAAEGQGLAVAVVAEQMHAGAPGLRIARHVETAVRRDLALRAHLAVEAAYRPVAAEQGQPAAVVQAGQCLVLALQLVFHLPRQGAAGGGGGQQVGVGQLQHQARQQAGKVAHALLDALLAEGVGQYFLVVLGRVVPG